MEPSVAKSPEALLGTNNVEVVDSALDEEGKTFSFEQLLSREVR